MTDFEMMKAMLKRADPDQKTWYIEPWGDLQVIYTRRNDDEWYTVTFFFEPNGQLRLIK